MNTARIAEPISGDKLYQRRARAALPLLVRQAQAGTPIFYSALAEELGMPNSRNLNYVLGSIGQSLVKLSRAWRAKVPPIQCLVINKATGLPGNGVGWFLDARGKGAFSRLPLRRRREIVDVQLQMVYGFPRWAEVLEVLSLKPVTTGFTAMVKKASTMRSGGESEAHKVLKEFVARNPGRIGLTGKIPKAVVELPLPSGDKLDVSFRGKARWVAVEVKSAISAEEDIVRGLFQCVKYRAVLEAVQASEVQPQGARAILVLEGSLPSILVPLCNILGVEVVENVDPRSG